MSALKNNTTPDQTADGLNGQLVRAEVTIKKEAPESLTTEDNFLNNKSEGELAASRKDNAASPQQQTGHGETKAVEVKSQITENDDQTKEKIEVEATQKSTSNLPFAGLQNQCAEGEKASEVAKKPTTVESEEYSEEEDDYDDFEPANRPKRCRTAYSLYQLDQLEWVFTQTHYPDVLIRQELSTRLTIPEAKLQIWFQNRRARWRKQQRTGCVSSRSRQRKRQVAAAMATMPHNMTMPTPMNTVAPWGPQNTNNHIGPVGMYNGGIPPMSQPSQQGFFYSIGDSNLQGQAITSGPLPNTNHLPMHLPPIGAQNLQSPSPSSSHSTQAQLSPKNMPSPYNHYVPVSVPPPPMTHENGPEYMPFQVIQVTEH